MSKYPIIDPFKIKHQETYTVDEVFELINYIRMLEERNEEQADRIKELIDEIESVKNRLAFYRNATLPKDINKE
tara:strand:+ start:521 stop:742 length:222 start_codon:yes stop_codon:yes gene_type:complete